MPRRRLTLAAYVRRRWRVVGAIVVLLLGALLVLAVTDRGHDPLWQTRATDLDQAAFAPDASAVYALLRENGNLSRVVAHRGDDGALLWEGRLNATRALLTAGPSGTAVATDFPFAFLTVYGADGSIRWQLPLEGQPVAIALEGEHLALALNAPSAHNPVLVFEGSTRIHTFRHATAVRALDLEAGRIATGATSGDIVVRDMRGTELLNASLGLSPTSLRLTSDGMAVVVGGHGLTPEDTRGHVAFLDVGDAEPVRWQRDTPSDVGLVDTDAAGLVALAVEGSPPTAILHVYDGATGATRWTRLLAGSVSHDDAGAYGGAALSPDARRVAVGTLRGAVQVFDARTGDEEWSYRAGGVTVLDFADDEGHRLVVGGRLLANRPFDSLLLFSAGAEPLVQQAALLAGGLVVLAVLTLALLLAVGFWRARGTY